MLFIWLCPQHTPIHPFPVVLHSCVQRNAQRLSRLTLFLAVCGGILGLFAQATFAQSGNRPTKGNFQGQKIERNSATHVQKVLPATPVEKSPASQNVSVSEDGLMVQKTIKLGADATDQRIHELLAQLLASYPKAKLLIFVSQGTSGVCANGVKYAYDRQLKRLVYLHSSVCNILTGPQESYNWRIWFGVEESYLRERLPWLDELIQTDKSTPGQDGRNNLPVSYPGSPEVTVWPQAGVPTASLTRD